jgi:hypothetical protein
MALTRFMEVMFSNKDEELANQVDNDIKNAQKNGVVDTEEVRYERANDNGDVAITDKENGEVTIAQKATDEADTYDLIAVPDEQLEKFLHPSEDGVHEGNQVGAPDEHVEDHFKEGCVISPNLECGGLNPEAGHEKSIVETDEEHQDEEREFSVITNNAVVSKIFSDQEFCERIFSEVIESEETAKVGDLKIEKLEDEDNAVVVTNETTGDQAKVVLDDDDMTVTELDSKNFSNEDAPEGYMPLFVVGVQPYDHIIVDAQEYDEDSAEQLKNQLTEDGVDAVEIFDNQEDARDYAMRLIDGLGANVDPEEEPELQKEYSDFVGAPVFATRIFSNNTAVMCKLFSDAVNSISDLQDEIEDAVREGDEIETDELIITPVDAQTAVVEDKVNDEFTKATISGDDVRLEQIDEEEFDDLTSDLKVMEVESDEFKPLADDDEEETCPECGKAECECPKDDEEEKEYSVFCDETETKFFSRGKEINAYMERLFNEQSEQNAIEDAIENGDEIETDTEIITPIDSKTAVVEDKENGDFSKVKIIDEDTINVHPISEEEAENLTQDIAVDEDSAVDEDEKEEEKEYSIFCNEAETRFFSKGEEFTAYMERIFSEEADQDEIEKAIEDGEQIENDTEVITPVDAETAVVEDKETGEFTKAVLKDEDDMELTKISEKEADKLTEDLAVEDKEDVDEDEKEEEKEYSFCNEAETRFFSKGEEFTAYMERIFSEEADQEEIEKAIEEGEQIENDTEVITPVDSETAVVEDKETGEFTKAVLKDEEDMELTKISEEEADKLTEDLAVEDKEDVDEDKFDKVDEDKDGQISKEEWRKAGKSTDEFDRIDKNHDGFISKEEWNNYESEEKHYSTLDKFFADVQASQAAPVKPVAVPVAQPVVAPQAPAEEVSAQAPAEVDENGNPVAPAAHTVEEVEDKALAAVQSIKAAAEEAAATIMEAKAAPAEDAEPDLQEAQFTEKSFSDSEDTLATWLNFKK